MTPVPGVQILALPLLLAGYGSLPSPSFLSWRAVRTVPAGRCSRGEAFVRGPEDQPWLLLRTVWGEGNSSRLLSSGVGRKAFLRGKVPAVFRQKQVFSRIRSRKRAP